MSVAFNIEQKGQVTRLLRAWSGGDQKALSNLLPLVYHQLRRMARRHVRQEREGHTLQPSDLIHEAFLRLLHHDVQWQNRAHFLAVASRAMRQVLVDYAKKRNRVKRCGNGIRISLSEAVRLKPDFALARDVLSRLYLQGGENEKAIEQCRLALRDNPDDEIALYRLIRALQSSGSPDAAAETPDLLKRFGALREKLRAREAEAGKYRLVEEPATAAGK